MAGILERETLPNAAQYLLQSSQNVPGAFCINTGCRGADFEIIETDTEILRVACRILPRKPLPHLIGQDNVALAVEHSKLRGEGIHHMPRQCPL